MAKTVTKAREAAHEVGEAAPAIGRGPIQAAMQMQEALPPAAFAIAAGASILASAILFSRRQRDWAIFVGEWAPTFLIMGLFFKLLRPSGR